MVLMALRQANIGTQIHYILCILNLIIKALGLKKAIPHCRGLYNAPKFAVICRVTARTATSSR